MIFKDRTKSTKQNKYTLQEACVSKCITRKRRVSIKFHLEPNLLHTKKRGEGGCKKWEGFSLLLKIFLLELKHLPSYPIEMEKFNHQHINEKKKT